MHYQYVVQGQSFVIPLPAINFSLPVLDLTWQEDDVELSGNDVLITFTLQLDLVLLSVDLNQNEKVYRVMANYYDFTSQSSPTAIRVTGLLIGTHDL